MSLAARPAAEHVDHCTAFDAVSSRRRLAASVDARPRS
jgi:hypothetical protein